jgi:hypothetical protein
MKNRQKIQTSVMNATNSLIASKKRKSPRRCRHGLFWNAACPEVLKAQVKPVAKSSANRGSRAATARLLALQRAVVLAPRPGAAC